MGELCESRALNSKAGELTSEIDHVDYRQNT